MHSLVNRSVVLLKGVPSWLWCFAISTTFLLATQLRILNYACGNDPMLYIRGARTILRPALYGADAVREALTFVAPGYPVLLAACIALFGDLSPYWLNVALLILLVPIMWFVFRRIMGSGRAALFSSLGMWIIIFRGHPLHAPYLLYPFREVARLLFVFISFAWVVWALHGKRRLRMHGVFSAIALLAACVVREPSALIWPGMVLGILCCSGSGQERWRLLQGFMIPWLGLGLIAVPVVMFFDVLSITQFSVLPYLQNHEVALARIQQMWSWFPARMTWFGLVLVILGVLRACVSGRVLIGWLLIPAALTFVFYAYMHMHVRYFLTTIILLAPFAGYGLDGIARVIEKSVSRFPGLPLIRPFLTAALFVALCVGLADTYRHTRMWGPGLTAKQVHSWQQLVAGLEPSASGRITVAVEQRSRYLKDLLLSYTDVQLLDPKEIQTWPKNVLPSHYFQPMNDWAFYETPQWLMYKQVFAHCLIADEMNLLPLEDKAAEEHWVGRGKYRQMRITPWSTGPHSQSLDIKTGRDVVLWTDWGSAAADQAGLVALELADDETTFIQWNVPATGFQPVYADVTDDIPAEAVLRARADAPIPARPVVAMIGEGDSYVIRLARDRPLSANALFPTWSRGRRVVNYVQPGFRADQHFELATPELPGAEEEVVWRVALWFYPRDLGQSRVLEIRRPRLLPLEIELVAEANPVYFLVRPGSLVEVAWHSNAPEADRGRVHIDRIGFEWCRSDEDGDE